MQWWNPFKWRHFTQFYSTVLLIVMPWLNSDIMCNKLAWICNTNRLVLTSNILRYKLWLLWYSCSLDKLLDGGLFVGEMCEVAGKTAVGKTQVTSYTVLTFSAFFPKANTFHFQYSYLHVKFKIMLLWNFYPKPCTVAVYSLDKLIWTYRYILNILCQW